MSAANVGASLPALGRLATEFLAGGTVLALIALACIIIPVRMAAASAEGLPPAHDH
jgi:MFS superfamily sulfate permease-like transporter